MAGLFAFLFLISLIILVVGLISPSLFKKFLGERATRKGVGTIFGIATLVFFVLVGLTAEPNNKKESNNESGNITQESSSKKEDSNTDKSKDIKNKSQDKEEQQKETAKNTSSSPSTEEKSNKDKNNKATQKTTDESKTETEDEADYYTDFMQSYKTSDSKTRLVSEISVPGGNVGPPDSDNPALKKAGENEIIIVVSEDWMKLPYQRRWSWAQNMWLMWSGAHGISADNQKYPIRIIAIPWSPGDPLPTYDHMRQATEVGGVKESGVWVKE